MASDLFLTITISIICIGSIPMVGEEIIQELESLVVILEFCLPCKNSKVIVFQAYTVYAQ